MPASVMHGTYDIRWCIPVALCHHGVFNGFAHAPEVLALWPVVLLNVLRWPCVVAMVRVVLAQLDERVCERCRVLPYAMNPTQSARVISTEAHIQN